MSEVETRPCSECNGTMRADEPYEFLGETVDFCYPCKGTGQEVKCPVCGKWEPGEASGCGANLGACDEHLGDHTGCCYP